MISTGRDLTELIELKNKIEKNEIINQMNVNELKHLKTKYVLDNIIYTSDAMNKLIQKSLKISSTSSTVLIQGESGVGKEVIADFIFNNSKRKNSNFIKVNCSSIPENLLESELFGYEEGSFSGAKRGGKIGIFEAANKGTVFLDEIGDLSKALQAKLLRVIQNKEVLKIGSVKARAIDVRFITATNKDLKKMVEKGTFRKDLFYRLNVLPLTIPPLRERREDIPVLALHFLKKFNMIHSTIKKLAPGAMKEFYYYDWPGNIRELQNIIERVVITSESSEITGEEVNDLLQESRSSYMNFQINNELSLKDNIRNLERFIIKGFINNNKSIRSAAKRLGVSPSTLLRKMSIYSIKKE